MNHFLPSLVRRVVLRCQAFLAIVVAQVILTFASFQTLQHLIGSVRWVSRRPQSADRIIAALRAGARVIPGSTCLVQALAGQVLLIHHGYQPQLTIGICKDENDRFTAHAWVTCDGKVLIGCLRPLAYKPLLTLAANDEFTASLPEFRDASHL